MFLLFVDLLCGVVGEGKRRKTKEEKKLLQEKDNQERLSAAIGTLENVNYLFC